MIEMDNISRGFGSGDNVKREDGIKRNYYSTVDNIKINNISGSALTDYQVTVTKNTSDNVRFAQVKKIDHWKESDDKIWVKVNYLANAINTLIYMYYGNSGANSESNGTNTFEFFDDFEDGDVSDWTQTNLGLGELTAVTDPVKQGNYAGKWHFSGSGTAYSYKQIPELANGDKVLEWYWRVPQTDKSPVIMISTDAADYEPAFQTEMHSNGYFYYYDGANHDVKTYNANQWYKSAIVITKGSTSSTFDWWIDKNLSETPDVNDGGDRGSGTSFKYFELMFGTGGSTTLDQFVDEIHIRKYASPEPTVSIVGTIALL